MYNDANPGGGATYDSGNLALSNTGDTIDSNSVSITCMFTSIETGSFSFNSSTSPFTINFVNLTDTSSTTYSTSYGGEINVNISSLSNNTLARSALNPGRVIGTFEDQLTGYIINAGSPPEEVNVVITEGAFEAVGGS